MSTEESLRVIGEFLSNFATEVVGLSSDDLTPEMKEKIRLLSLGKLSEEERSDLFRELLSNQRAFECLVERLKSSRIVEER